MMLKRRTFNPKRRLYPAEALQAQQPLWQVVLHAVNHGTHHRGQVSGFLRTLGHTPPVTDLSHFYRRR